MAKKNQLLKLFPLPVFKYQVDDYEKINSEFYDLQIRIISGLVFGALGLFSLALGGLIATVFLAFCLAVLGWEILYIFSNGNVVDTRVGKIIPIILFLVPILNFYDFYPVIILLSSALVSTFYSESKVLKMFCMLYVSFSVLMFQEILFSEKLLHNFYNLLLVVGAVASSDIGGYFFGRIVGGPKIYKSISPNKTWAGSLGGVLCSVIACLLISPLFDHSLSWACFLGFVLAVSAQAGDFFESWLKRKFKMKDSGVLLPGHGGFFDRLDGLLAAVPVYCGLVFFM